MVVKLGTNTSNAASNQIGVHCKFHSHECFSWAFTGSFRGEDVCCLPWARWWRTVTRNTMMCGWSSCTLRLIYMWMLLPFLFQKRGLPSGKLTVCYWKWPFIVDFPIDSMVIFHSHVSLPEGIPPKCPFQWEDVEHPEAMVAWAHFSDKPD